MNGKAYLVGAGPGQADLITVRGLALVRQAEVLVYDRLIAAALVDAASPEAEKIFVGKAPGKHSAGQEEINQLLVSKVREGKLVVRLKGGDPFVFGRGGEEGIALAEAGLPFEVVPGITSSIAAPAYAGIPVTHRGISTGFAVITGHQSAKSSEDTTDWRAFAKVPTVVVMMGVSNVANICQALIEGGKDPHTPAAAIQQGTTSQQRVVRAELATLAEKIAEERVLPPAVIVIGEVVNLSDTLSWVPQGVLQSNLVANQPHIEAAKGGIMKKQEVVLIGHGSRVPHAVTEFNAFAESLAESLGQPVHTGFLELSEPEMHQALEEAAQRAGEGGEVVAIPMFLGAAMHMKLEISAIIQHVQEEFPHTAIRWSTPLGFHYQLAELLKVRVDEALADTPDALPAEETTVLVVGGGSSDYDSNSSVSKVARVLHEIGGYAAVEVAYQRVTHPNTPEGIERVHRLGAKQVVVVPYLLFTGIVHQKTVAFAEDKAGEFDMPLIHAQYLGPTHPLLLEVVRQRMAEALDGTSEMLRSKTVEGMPLVQTGGHHHAHHDESHYDHHDHECDGEHHHH